MQISFPSIFNRKQNSNRILHTIISAVFKFNEKLECFAIKTCVIGVLPTLLGHRQKPIEFGNAKLN